MEKVKEVTEGLNNMYTVVGDIISSVVWAARYNLIIWSS
jgi:hypothetical protein